LAIFFALLGSAGALTGAALLLRFPDTVRNRLLLPGRLRHRPPAGGRLPRHDPQGTGASAAARDHRHGAGRHRAFSSCWKNSCGYMRVTTALPEDNARFLAALTDVL
jgi:hypothetical protein